MNGRHDEFAVTDRVLWSVAEYFEDLRHLPSGSQVHSEAWHGAACGQADYAAQRRSKIVKFAFAPAPPIPSRRLHFPRNLKLSVSFGCNFLKHVLLEGGGGEKKQNTHTVGKSTQQMVKI